MYHPPNDTAGNIWRPAPTSYPPNNSSGAIQGVYLSPGEDVEWSYMHHPDGSTTINGYTIIKKPRKTLPKR